MWTTANWKILKNMEKSDHLICLLRNLYVGQEATVRTDMEQQTGSKLGKEYDKAVFCHPAYLTLVQSIQLCPTFCNPMDCSPPDSSVHGIFQVRILEWIAIFFSRGSSWSKDETHIYWVSCFGRRILLPLAPSMWNARLNKTQAGIKTARRNINNLRYADDTTLMTETEEELKSLLMRVKEESEKAGLKLNI